MRGRAMGECMQLDAQQQRIEDDRQKQLDTVLADWHRWQEGARVSRGFASHALVVGEFRISRQYDDCNGALDDDLRKSTCKIVQCVVDQMPDPWRSAAYILARECCTGLAVWSSPRLPQSPAERQAVMLETRGKLVRRLVVEGVIG